MIKWIENSKYLPDIRLAYYYIKEYKRLFFLNLFILLGIFLFEGAGVGLIIPIMQKFVGQGQENTFTQVASSVFSYVHIEYTFLNVMIIFTIILMLKYGLIALQRYYTRVLCSTITFRLRKDSFGNLMELPIGYYYGKKLGDMVADVFTSSGNAGGLSQHVIDLIMAIFFCLLYIGINFLISYKLMLITLFVASISLFLIIPFLKKLSKKGEIVKKLTDNMTSFLTDKLGAIKDIKSFNNEKLHNIEFDDINTSFKKIAIKIMGNKIAASLLLEPVMMFVAIVLLVVSVEVFHMEIAYLFAFSYVIILFIPKLRSINENYMSILEYLPHFSRVQMLISREGKTYLADGVENIQCFKSAIHIKNVWFNYIPSRKYVLKDISLKIEKNMTVALVGSSGGGKSTLISLLLRLQDPEKGSICIDGVDLRNIKINSLLKIVGVVHQDPYLFHDTIYNNIIYGKTNARKEDVLVASKMAHAHDFIMELSEQYNTVVGVRGLRLSGGQKQRIALARALIKNPEILILDEAMSALDNESERFIQEAIEKIKGKKTIIVIAHRLSTVLRSDKIVVIEQGMIVQEGRHNELVSIPGPYKTYCDLSQFN